MPVLQKKAGVAYLRRPFTMMVAAESVATKVGVGCPLARQRRAIPLCSRVQIQMTFPLSSSPRSHVGMPSRACARRFGRL